MRRRLAPRFDSGQLHHSYHCPMGDISYKACNDCGKRFQVGPRSRNRKYCTDCVKRRDLENRRVQKAKLKAARYDPANLTRNCTQCGATFVRLPGRPGAAITRCDTCRAAGKPSKRTLPESLPCQRCGKQVKLNPGARRKYCDSCRLEVSRERDREIKARARVKEPRTMTCQQCGTKFQKNPRGRDPRTCPDCWKQSREGRRSPRKVPTETMYAWRIRRQYGLTVEQRQLMADRQGHACYLCGTPETSRRLHIDHDHSCCATSGMSCGKCVRGLICRPCNQALGFVGDDLETLQRMVAYLKAGGAPYTPNRSRVKKRK